MCAQPKKKIDLAVELFDSLRGLSGGEFKRIAEMANFQARSAYKDFPNDIDILVTYAVTEAVLGKITKAIKLLENDAIPKITTLNRKNYGILVYMNYAQFLIISNQPNKALDAIRDIEDLLDPKKNEKFIKDIEELSILTVALRIYFQFDLLTEMIVLVEKVESLYQNTVIVLLNVFKMLVYYKYVYSLIKFL
jgi:hypothetical protein